MKYEKFREKLRNNPIFRSNTFARLDENVNLLRRQVTDWVKQQKVIQLKRGVYTLSAEDRAIQFSQYFLSAELCSPSYISLESALSFYNLIPEKVNVVTAITTKKTQQYENVYGTFHYRHIRMDLFDTFRKQQDEYGLPYYIAIPEKALIDFFYFKCRTLNKFDQSVFEKDFRLQNLASIDVERLIAISKQYNKKKLSHMVTLFVRFLEEDHD